MNAQQITAKLTSFIENAISSPLSFALWIIGTVAILAVTSTVLAPLVPQFFRPVGDVQKWVWVAGFVYLMKGAGR